MTLRQLRRILLPTYTRRWLVFSIVREALSHPAALPGRVNRTNRALRAIVDNIWIDCNICGGHARLFYDMPDIRKRRDHEIRLLRETAECRMCAGTMRHRTLAAALLKRIHAVSEGTYRSIRDYVADPMRTALTILDTDSFSPLHKLLRGTTGYSSTKYFPNRLFGEEIELGVWNNDLQDMKFADNSFDIVLSSDVMEHVADDNAAHSEIHRVLKPGGSYVFTVPYNPNYEVNRIMAVQTSHGTLTFEQPHYHGDPLTAGILAYRIYGRELTRSLESIGLAVVFTDLFDLKTGIFNGDYFTATKR